MRGVWVCVGVCVGVCVWGWGDGESTCHCGSNVTYDMHSHYYVEELMVESCDHRLRVPPTPQDLVCVSESLK